MDGALRFQEVMEATRAPTTQSRSYRKRAADLARVADASAGLEEQVNLMNQALQWIQLAENEEFTALHQPRANDN